jgi:hypothetical protein
MDAWYKNAELYALNLGLWRQVLNFLALSGLIEGAVDWVPDSGVAALHATV